MSTITSQASFNSGEWAPTLSARVDLQKYHSAAAKLLNFYVDYRGGVSTRVGTRFVLPCFKSNLATRLLPFQASKSLGFALEFGDGYIRFHRNGVPTLEGTVAITGATRANPCVVSVVNTYSVGNWVFISGVAGMTQLNGKYYIISARTGGTITLQDLQGNNIDSTAYSIYTAGGTTQRVYTLTSPYAAADLALVKYSQNVSSMILTHPNYQPQILTYTAPTSWTIGPIVFGTTIGPPTITSFVTSLFGGSANYTYVVTTVDANGQESVASSVLNLANFQDIRITPGSTTINWNGVTGAQFYNVYRTQVVYGLIPPAGSAYGYLGSASGTSFTDSNIAPDFSTTPPIIQSPFTTNGMVQSVTINTLGSYAAGAIPTPTFAAPGGGGVTATGQTLVGIITAAVAAGGVNYAVNDLISFATGAQVKVLTLAGSAVATVLIVNPGSTSAPPANAVSPSSTSGAGTGATFNLTWGVIGINITNPGSNYSSPPAITFSGGAAAATANLGPAGYGFPSVSTFFQQRLVLAGTNNFPQILLMSQPGNYFNFNTSNPSQASDAITASIVSAQLNNIKALIPQPGGLIVVTDGVSFLVNGGALGAAVSPSAIVANQQSYIGSSDLPPIVSNYDILTIPAKGSSVRDSTYNFYANVFTGTDISVLSSHLFYGYQLVSWAWAEEPFKTVWAIRSDGALLSLTFIKEQDFIAWALHQTNNGFFLSNATIVEQATTGYQNFVYFIVRRTIAGGTQQYVEYMPERLMPNGVVDANTVDCSYQYSGSPATTFTGAMALAGMSVTGLADGVPIPSFTMPTSGTFTLTSPASKVTVGLAFTAQLQTLYLDTQGTADGSVQGKQKKIANVTLRVADTLGLQAGTSFANTLNVKDLTIGNVGSMTNQPVTGLVTGDVRPWMDPLWNEAGQYCFQQVLPYPATILGVFPSVIIGDTSK